MVKLFVTLLLLLTAVSLRGHEGLDESLEALTARLAASPDNAQLHLQRAETHQAHNDLPAAAADLARAEQLDARLPDLDLVRAKIALADGRPGPARQALDRFLARQPDHRVARELRARASGQLGEVEAAVADWVYLCENSSPPDPGYFLARATLLQWHGRPTQALAALDDGLRRLGPLPVLLQRALEIEEALGRTEAALARVDALLAVFERKEQWFVRRGDLLLAAGRSAEASTAYAQALKEIDDLPERLRRQSATQTLRIRVAAHFPTNPTPTRTLP